MKNQTWFTLLLVALLATIGMFGCQTDETEESLPTQEAITYGPPAPLAMRPIPERFRRHQNRENDAPWRDVRAWLVSLSDDDLVAFGLVPRRGINPLRDLPADLPNRGEILERVLHLWGNFHGLAGAEDQSTWLYSLPEHKLIMSNSSGTDWGFEVEERSGALDDFDPINLILQAYVWRDNYSSTNAVLPLEEDMAWAGYTVNQSGTLPQQPAQLGCDGIVYKYPIKKLEVWFESQTSRYRVAGQDATAGILNYQDTEDVRPEAKPFWTDSQLHGVRPVEDFFGDVNQIQPGECIAAPGNCTPGVMNDMRFAPAYIHTTGGYTLYIPPTRWANAACDQIDSCFQEEWDNNGSGCTHLGNASENQFDEIGCERCAWITYRNGYYHPLINEFTLNGAGINGANITFPERYDGSSNFTTWLAGRMVNQQPHYSTMVFWLASTWAAEQDSFAAFACQALYSTDDWDCLTADSLFDGNRNHKARHPAVFTQKIVRRIAISDTAQLFGHTVKANTKLWWRWNLAKKDNGTDRSYMLAAHPRDCETCDDNEPEIDQLTGFPAYWSLGSNGRALQEHDWRDPQHNYRLNGFHAFCDLSLNTPNNGMITPSLTTRRPSNPNANHGSIADSSLANDNLNFVRTAVAYGMSYEGNFFAGTYIKISYNPPPLPNCN